MNKVEYDVKNQNCCPKCKKIVGLNYNPATKKTKLAKHSCK